MRRDGVRWGGLFLLAAALWVSPALASMHEAHIPLRDGKLETAELCAAMLKSIHLPGVGFGTGSLDLSGLQGGDFVAAMNAALADSGSVELSENELLLRVDPEKLPRNVLAIKKAIRTFTEVAAPTATANQQRTYGLFLPAEVAPDKPMVVLVHGLDCNRSNWCSMAELLSNHGWQVAYFSYPSDEPIGDSAQIMARHMKMLRDTYPNMPVDIIAHSMGGLVARAYLEGDAYAGGVQHFIMLGTPNLGSRWASYRIGLELQEHYYLWKYEPDWSPTWMITDGLGEAGHDLRPTSSFLKDLNARPRREGVKYTIVAGDQHPVARFTAKTLDGTANLVPDRIANWWGIRQTEHALHHAAGKLRRREGTTDGPVTVASTKLAGVDDFVVLPADHNTLYLAMDGGYPAAWDVIEDRLAK